MKTQVLNVIILGYGIGIKFIKRKGHNPNKDDYDSDDSVKKYSIGYFWGEYSNPFFAFNFIYNYTLHFTLYLDRE